MRRIIWATAFLMATSAQAGDWSYARRRSLSADAMQSFGVTQGNYRDDAESFRVYSLGGNFNLLGDCGNLDVKTSFHSIYAEANRLFEDLKEAAIGSAESVGRAAPMLALCYFSPTACSIAKNLQLYASYSAKLKFDQCQAINRYTSQQAGVYKETQAACLRQSISKNGNITEAVETCKNSADKLASWLDGSKQIDRSSNQLIQTSAKWAGIKAQQADLLTALVGGIEYQASGNLQVNFGRYSPVTPGRLFEYYNKAAYRKLCGERGLLQNWVNGRNPDLNESDYFQSKNKSLLDAHLMQALTRLPDGEREAACDRLAQSMSLTKFIDEMEERFSQLYVMAQNPHLPETERNHLEQKTKKLVDHTLAVLKIKNLRQDSLNTVRSHILSSAGKISAHDSARASNLSAPNKRETPLTECTDFATCGGQ